jgi:hypothetical protein
VPCTPVRGRREGRAAALPRQPPAAVGAPRAARRVTETGGASAGGSATTVTSSGAQRARNGCALAASSASPWTIGTSTVGASFG